MGIVLRKFPILIILWLFCFQFHVGSVWSQCLQDQQSLLIQFKENATFNSTLSTKLVSWNSSTDCCGWGGVKCSGAGHVIGLDLSNESISGGIDSSSSLFDLDHLQSLDLAWNQFGFTQIPSGIGKLVNLRQLNLSNAKFSGQIPAEISGLTRLVSLNLSSIGGGLFSSLFALKLENPNLSMLVRNLTRLTELDLRGTNISAEGNGWCRALSPLTSLRVLNLAACRLSGPIDYSLAKLKSLSVLTLSGNTITPPVPEFLGNFSNLTSLDLSACTGLYGKFPEKIFQLPHLQNIDLSLNYDLQGFIPEFPANGSLQTLLLSSTSFGGNLPESIGNLEEVSRIELSRCKFNGSIPDSMAKLAQLVSLDFSDNNFSGPIPSFSSAKGLMELKLANNHLSGSILSTNWSKLSKLVTIDLQNNSLDGAIPASLFGIPSLQTMYLSHNQFTGRLDGPSTLAFSALEFLDLRSNKLGGPFPMFISQFRSLWTFQLSSNNLTGPVNLSSFQQLRNLSNLDLSYNNLWVDETGIDAASFPKLQTISLASCKLKQFPTFLERQSMLTQLDLSNNQMGGELPNWIWNLEHLSFLNLSHNFLVNLQGPLEGLNATVEVLDLSDNKLQGQLPKPPPFIHYADFSSNNLSSVLPVDIGDYFRSAVFLSLANNNLHGSIPQSICNATSLAIINLSNNSLNGTIPECLFGMESLGLLESLGVLNLRENNLSGNIPDTFSTKCGVQTLDLNGNHLEGQIPRSLADCNRLEVLDLGNNRISDAFPSHLKNISSLRVLVLRSNNLHGDFDCVEGNYSWPMLQIVDLASNQFSGVLPVQCLRNWKGMMAEKDEIAVLHQQYYDSSRMYYQDTIKVTMKNQEMLLTKILSVFASLDLSSNNFEGKIPGEIGEFKALYVLNLSHNSFASLIPSSLGNLGNLESLDLYSNNLSGEIPQQLAGLNFLAVLNLSHNQLEGRIPSGSQFQTFSEDSFRDNKGLCGVPLKESCSPSAPPPKASEDKRLDNELYVDWNFLSVELGFAFGLGIFILPLIFWRRWSKWYCRHVDVLLSRLLPRLYYRSRNRGGRTSRRTRTTTRLSERNQIAGEVAPRPQVSKLRTGRAGRVIVV